MTDLNVDKLTPPPELVQQWRNQAPTARDAGATRERWIARQAAWWGADQELEACVQWISEQDWTWTSAQLRRFRRPNPPSLKEQALRLVADYGVPFYRYTAEQTDTIRRALEAMPND